MINIVLSEGEQGSHSVNIDITTDASPESVPGRMLAEMEQSPDFNKSVHVAVQQFIGQPVSKGLVAAMTYAVQNAIYVHTRLYAINEQVRVIDTIFPDPITNQIMARVQSLTGMVLSGSEGSWFGGRWE